MYRSYFYLNRFIVELNDLLNDHTIRSAFSQEKDKLVIECVKDFEERFFLEISVNPGNPFITFREDFRRARKNVTDLFRGAYSKKVISAGIASGDRVIRLLLEDGAFYFLIRGKFTNIIYLQNGELEFFKHQTEADKEELRNELKNIEFISAFNFPSVELETDSDFPSEVRTKYPFIGREIVKETLTRTNAEVKDEFISSLNKVILSFLNEKPVICKEITGEIHLVPETFRLYACNERADFDAYIPALNAYLGKKASFEASAEKEKLVEKNLEKELNKITQRLDKLRERISGGSREETYRRSGDLLMLNRHLLRKGMESIEVQDIYAGGETVKIKIDPSLSPQQNIDLYFNKAKKEKINYEKSLQLLSLAEKSFIRLRSLKEKFEDIKSPGEIQYLMKELKIKGSNKVNQAENAGDKFKQYLIDKDYRVYVGKDSKNNDLLTTKFAKQNDYWFHARSVAGSHVVLRNDNPKSPVPKNILKKAASLAAYHSKAKTAGVVPVSFTQKKYVVKKKGMEPGKVALLREEVLLVRPEIPEGVEYVTEEGI